MYKAVGLRRLCILLAVLCFLCLFSSFAALTYSSVSVFSQGGVLLPVIMYHQISENSGLWGDYVIPEKLLREDFLYIKESGYTPVSVRELEEFTLRGGRLPEKPILITFDDGERSFLTKVLPLLKEFSYPATVAVVGSLTDLYTESGDTDDRYAYLNWDDLEKLSLEPLVEIANHSYNMHSLTARRGMGQKDGESDNEYISALTADFRGFHKEFSEHLNIKPTILAYPYGIENSVLSDFAKSEGYTVTLTCAQKVNNISRGGSLYELGRFNRPYRLSTEDFFEKLKA